MCIKYFSKPAMVINHNECCHVVSLLAALYRSSSVVGINAVTYICEVNTVLLVISIICISGLAFVDFHHFWDFYPRQFYVDGSYIKTEVYVPAIIVMTAAVILTLWGVKNSCFPGIIPQM
jgi:hypothetical protein